MGAAAVHEDDIESGTGGHDVLAVAPDAVEVRRSAAVAGVGGVEGRGEVAPVRWTCASRVGTPAVVVFGEPLNLGFLQL